MLEKWQVAEMGWGGDNEHSDDVIISREGAAIAPVPFGKRGGC